MLAQLLLKCLKAMLKRSFWSRGLPVKNVGKFSKQTVTLSYVLFVRKKNNLKFG